jgi:hypothetical protein
MTSVRSAPSRAISSRASEQHLRQTGENADFGFREVEVCVDLRDNRRNGDHRQAQRDAREPQQRDAFQQIAAGHAAALGGTNVLSHLCAA